MDGTRVENVGRAQRDDVSPKTGRVAEEHRKANRHSHGARKDVVLFLPGPFTGHDLLGDSIKSARVRLKTKTRRRHARWVEENIGTLIFVAGLFALTWFVAAR
jgi:hypothetical protein